MHVYYSYSENRFVINVESLSFSWFLNIMLSGREELNFNAL